MSTTIPAPDVEQLSQTRPVLFFDGVCGLCNQSVDFIVKRDRAEKFLFAPLQGEAAAGALPPADVQDLNSLVLMKQGRLYRKSAAVVRILWELPIVWQLAGTLLWLIPLPLRNWGYGIVSKYRYKMFGQKETCRMPTPSERARFLD